MQIARSARFPLLEACCTTRAWCGTAARPTTSTRSSRVESPEFSSTWRPALHDVAASIEATLRCAGLYRRWIRAGVRRATESARGLHIRVYVHVQLCWVGHGNRNIRDDPCEPHALLTVGRHCTTVGCTPRACCPCEGPRPSTLAVAIECVAPWIGAIAADEASAVLDYGLGAAEAAALGNRAGLPAPSVPVCPFCGGGLFWGVGGLRPPPLGASLAGWSPLRRAATRLSNTRWCSRRGAEHCLVKGKVRVVLRRAFASLVARAALLSSG